MNRKSFTLIELLVVVAIIGILAVVGTRFYGEYSTKAQSKLILKTHNQVCNYIKSEVALCHYNSTAMDGHLDCTKKRNKDFDEVVRDAIMKSKLNQIKNPATGQVCSLRDKSDILRFGPKAVLKGQDVMMPHSYGYHWISSWPNDPVKYRNTCCQVFVSTCHTVKYTDSRTGEKKCTCRGYTYKNGKTRKTSNPGPSDWNWDLCRIHLP